MIVLRGKTGRESVASTGWLAALVALARDKERGERGAVMRSLSANRKMGEENDITSFFMNSLTIELTLIVIRALRSLSSASG